MANVSSFFGELVFKNDCNPWTPEGFVLLYDILMSIDCSGGNYGICLDQDASDNSADFLEYLISQEVEEPSMGFWGSGRWSAENNFNSFDRWTMEKAVEQLISATVYTKNRIKLLELMHKNAWFLSFSYKDEEYGNAYIVEQEAEINASYNDEDKTYHFSAVVNTYRSAKHNLKNYSEIIDDQRNGDNFYEILNSLCDLLNVAEEYKDHMENFIIEQNWDEKLSAYNYYEELEELPDGLVKAWRKYVNEYIKK